MTKTGIGMTSARTRTRMIERLREEGIRDEVVLHAIASVPRHIFVDEALASRAYEDIALPLGFGQTISQPYIVARMSELLRANNKLNKVLEIGTGCGYQTAVLSYLAAEVYSIERVAPLFKKARTCLRELRLSNIKLKHGDGMVGLPDFAPFDAIIITAAAAHTPDMLLQQLAIGGRMVLPKGGQEQHLYLIERTPQGYSETQMNAVRFVPLLSGVA
jgi:protein-L-isoaspartate(D-aspartate) O-methyltransferase